MFTRDLVGILQELARMYPAVAILGPRQSGKTTLAKSTFTDYVYLSLEDRVVRERALIDPKGFFELYKDAKGIILDEFQYAPELLSYIQLLVDEKYRPGFFVLTGSQNFLMNQAISQSLAGRIGLLTLLSMSIAELKKNNLLEKPAEKAIFFGGYPRIYSQHIPPQTWYSDYIETYVEKDIRQINQVVDLGLFRKFIGLCAGRIGQLVSITSLSNDCGITTNMVKSWLSLLESSYIIYLMQPYHTNFGKRLIKSPKIYFYDTGLACSLLGITSELQLHTHYLRGGLFECLIIGEVLKNLYNQGQKPRIHFFQDSNMHEVDCIIDRPTPTAIEIKASQTINADFFKGLTYWNKITQTDKSHNYVVHTGSENQPWPQGTVISWQNVDEIVNNKKGL